MSRRQQTSTIGQLPTQPTDSARVASALTRLVWLSWLASLAVAVIHLRGGGPWTGPGVTVDGLTAVMWVAVTFFSGIVHSYSRRYMAGDTRQNRFFLRVFTFTLAVSVLVAADSFVVFVAAWIAMGAAMAGLIGHVEGWPQAQAAARLAGRYFLASAVTIVLALGVLWWRTGATAVSEVSGQLQGMSPGGLALVGGLLVLAAMGQSALIPFHSWLLSSMTAPTPASALMHAGFVNAGGVLLVRFAPVVGADPRVLFAAVVVGAVSAIGGKLMKTVQTDIKRALGCSTVGQMGFMILQAGLGFFGAAVTHLVLHGFYKAYQFLAAGSRVSHEAPTTRETSGSMSAPDAVVAAGTAVVGGGVFALLTGKGTDLDTGLVLTVLVVVTVLHATREAITQASLPATLRYGAVPLVALPAIGVYAAVYRVVTALLGSVPGVGGGAELHIGHGVVLVAFLAAYVAVETGAYRRSRRLYVALVNATQPATETQLTSTTEYNEH